MYPKNHVPKINTNSSATGCCPVFDPKEWDGKTFVLENKVFVKASTMSFLYVPLNMGRVMAKTWAAIEAAGAKDPNEFMLLSQDVSPWKANHYFWATKPVEGLDQATLSGTFKAKMFEGPFQEMKNWHLEMQKLAEAEGAPNAEIFFYYTTCPKCAKVYGKNYVVGLAKIK
jgi:hypothetical protein